MPLFWGFPGGQALGIGVARFPGPISPRSDRVVDQIC
jgi:hypothetical protein